MKTQEKIVMNGWKLVYENSGAPVYTGDAVADFRGDATVIHGGFPPRHEGSTGRVYTDEGDFFPGVVHMEWRPAQ